MLRTLSDAKAYAIEKITELTEETISLEEKFIIEDTIEWIFREKISQIVSDEELATIQATTPEEVEAALFHRIPNYVTLLEETTAEFMASYLLDDEEGEEDLEFDLEEEETHRQAEI